ncbi:MAG: hypothetical protein RIC14_00055 [Filomicrobium sp.]
MDFDRIRRNVKRMVDKGAPEADIDSYLDTEGLSAEQLKTGRKEKLLWDANRPAVRAQSYAFMGFDDEIQGGLMTLPNVMGQISRGEPIDVGKAYTSSRDHARKVKKEAFDSSDRSWGGYAMDVVGDTAGLTGQAVATLPFLPQRAVSAAPQVGNAIRQAGERLAFEFGKGTPQQTAAAATAQALKPMTGAQVAKESAQVGGAFGAANAYGETEGNAIQQTQDIAYGGLGGAALGYALPAAANAVGNYITQPVQKATQAERSRLAAQANQAANDFSQAGIDPKEILGPALVKGGPVEGVASHLEGTIFGAPLREAAGRSIAAVERRLGDELAMAGGAKTPAEAGQEVQGMLRNALTERSIPSNEVPKLSPERLQEISGIAPGPKFDPPRPVVDPIPPQPVRPQTADDVIRAARDEVAPVEPVFPPAREPQYPQQATPNYPRPKFEDVPTPASIATSQEFLASRLAGADEAYKGATAAREQAQQRLEAVLNEQGTVSGYIGIARQKAPNETAAFERALAAEKEAGQHFVFAQERLQKFEADMQRQQQKAYADYVKQQRLREDERVATANRDLPQRRRQAEQTAQQLTQSDRRLAQEKADLETLRLREQAEAQARTNADDLAQQRTAKLQYEAEQQAATRTKEAQQQADLEYEQGLAQRRADQDRPFELGVSDESFVTQLDAAYEAIARNAPAIQRNPLGSRQDPGRTRTAQLLDEFAQEGRRNMKLQGYRDGQVFDEAGGVRPDVMTHLEDRLGSEVASRIRAFSDARAKGRFVPSVQGLRDLRTAIGKEIEAAGKQRAQGETKTADEAMLSRLYDSLSQDIQGFLRAAGPDGQLAARQMMEIDGAYKRYLRDLRVPLSKVFGDKVAPEQAIATLRRAARKEGGDAQLLNRFYSVASAKGDRLRATNSILNGMTENGLAGFLDEWRNLSKEAKDIMFAGSAKHFGKALEDLAKAGGHLERYTRNANRTPRLRETISNPGNILAVLSGILHVHTAILGIAGAASTSRILASPKFTAWLRQAPKSIHKPQNWRRHATRLRNLLQAEAGISASAGQQIEELLVGQLVGQETREARVPAVVPRHRTRQDVIEQLQYGVE